MATGCTYSATDVPHDAGKGRGVGRVLRPAGGEVPVAEVGGEPGHPDEHEQHEREPHGDEAAFTPGRPIVATAFLSLGLVERHAP
jgi:hypothetical protein